MAGVEYCSELGRAINFLIFLSAKKFKYFKYHYKSRQVSVRNDGKQSVLIQRVVCCSGNEIKSFLCF